MLNICWNSDQCKDTEENPSVKVVLDSLLGENKLNDNFNFEELSSSDSIVSKGVLDSDSLVSSCDELRTLLIKDKVAGIEMLITLYERLFHQIAYGILCSYHLAQDAVSESYIKIYRWLERTEAAEILSINLFQYLCRIVINVSRDHLKMEKHQRLRKARQKQELLIDQRRCFETTDEVLERDEEKRIIHEEVDRLPANYRRAIRLRYLFDEYILDNLSETENERYAQLSVLLGVNEVTLRSHVYRGLKRLKKCLLARGIDH